MSLRSTAALAASYIHQRPGRLLRDLTRHKVPDKISSAIKAGLDVILIRDPHRPTSRSRTERFISAAILLAMFFAGVHLAHGASALATT
jgi:hypothetical protein